MIEEFKVAEKKSSISICGRFTFVDSQAISLGLEDIDGRCQMTKETLDMIGRSLYKF